MRPPHPLLARLPLLGLLGLLAGAGCKNEPTVVELRINPPNSDVRMTALFVVLIDGKTQNAAQVEPFLSVIDLDPPYTLNIAPPEGQDLSTLDVQLRVFGYYDNGRGGTPLTAFSSLDRFQFLPGIQTRYVKLDPLALACGQREGNSLGCLCFLEFGPDNTRDYPCYTTGQGCKEQDFGSGLPGAETLSVCLASQACPPGTVGCPCIGVIDGTCNAPYVCVEGTCTPCQEEGCGCARDDDCGAGLTCGGGTCCNPDNGCTCFSQDDCERAYPGKGISCVNNLCELATCNADDTLFQACESDDQCCNSYCFSGVCCNPRVHGGCLCQSDDDCQRAQYPEGFSCLGGYCQPPFVCPEGVQCCTFSEECGAYPNVCLSGACCNAEAGECPCQSDVECQTPEGYPLTCNGSTCEGMVDRCTTPDGRPELCTCDADEQCASLACCGIGVIADPRCAPEGGMCPTRTP